jgi:hypothetical protein
MPDTNPATVVNVAAPTTETAEPVAFTRDTRTAIYSIAAPVAVALLDVADKPITPQTIIHAAAIGLTTLASIVAASHVLKK